MVEVRRTRKRKSNRRIKTRKGGAQYRARPHLRPRPGTVRPRPQLRRRPSGPYDAPKIPRVAGTPVSVSEKEYRGGVDSDIIKPAYDLEVKSWYADFKTEGKYYRMYGKTEDDVTSLIQGYKNSL